ncbi:hypothetical protein EIP91_003141 [Steccherinum ochraceum]|uniref:Uncharacterized protein n=1 Tax=Steccherinum ochraceum TaxID=92696 RepID=A0A4R0S2I8_9APHY|nr:hypothetical protein EIP91_003141 [Steccherinum ochraceum]
MYRAPSPIFDVPELPALRRVKPLPKRRRTLDNTPPEDVDRSSSPGPDATAEELIAHADTLSAQMALQSYYMPILGGVQELFKNDPQDNSVDLGGMVGYGSNGVAVGAQDEDSGDGDYIDHLQQPGNTKKRKVPANMSGAAHGHDSSSASGGEDEPTDRAIPTGRTDSEYDSLGTQALNASSGGTGQRRGKLSRATAAGLQHKEMLKSRKRQLAVVLGALSHGDTLALDHALSTTYPFVHSTGDGSHPDSVRIRLSRRIGPRTARAYKAYRRTLSLPEHEVPFPDSDFTFDFHSATSDRLIATKEEVIALHARFEAEFARQTARAAEAAKQAAAVLSSLPGSKRADGTKQRRASPGKPATEQVPAVVDPTLHGTPARTGKKKKRSALANASNPHHLRNYVPSRLPHNGQLSTAQALANTQNLISPLPMRFLAADVPPRRRSKSDRNITPISTLSNPSEEWICPFCEYDLFFGDESALSKATRSRKKILRRRRRARERAAAAASGTGSATAKNASANANTTAAAAPVDADGQPVQNAPADGLPVAASGKLTRLKDERDRGGQAGTGTHTTPSNTTTTTNTTQSTFG